MYSIVMLMAMSGAPEMPAFGGRGGGGCCGQDACGCQGGGRGGFIGRGGRGCGGGGFLGGRRGGGGCCGQDACGCQGGYGYGGGGYGGGGCCGQVAQAGCGCVGGYGMGAGYGGAMVVNPTAATIVVNLPADAKLFFDGNVTTSTTANRRFTTPALQNGAEMIYTLTAEVVRDGKTLKASQVINVRGGQTTEVTLNDSQFATAVSMY